MPKPNKLRKTPLIPLTIAVVFILLSSLLIFNSFTLKLFIPLIISLVFGYWIGSLTNPAISYRKKKVKKQSNDIIQLNEQFRIQMAAMESAANGIVITDIHGVVEWVNPGFSKLTGYSAEEAVGESLEYLNSGVHDQAFFKHMWTQILEGNVWHDEVVNKRKDGTLYTEEMTITPVVDEHGKIKNFVAIKQDISERKRLEEISSTEKKRMETELDVARNIQMSMLEKNSQEQKIVSDLSIFAKLIPAREVGGDFYDYFWLDEERLCFFIGDVSGKGVPAALMMAVAKTLLKSAIGTHKSVSEALIQVNNEISKDNDNYMFITVIIGILNTTTGYLSYSNAGHNPTYVLDQQNHNIKALDELHGVVVGAMENIQYKETLLRINRGDSIFVYTDGITEARNKDNDLFSDERLLSYLERHIDLNGETLVNGIISDVKEHEAGAEQADDITTLHIHYMEQTEDSVVDYLVKNVPNNLKAIQAFTKQFDEFGMKHALPNEPMQQLKIVFDELLSNIVKYAYDDQASHEIEVKVRFHGEKLTITIMDDGHPYNPFESNEVDTSLGVEDREIGGLGIHLVKFLVDDYDYSYNEQIKKNSTHFTKLINSDSNEN